MEILIFPKHSCEYLLKTASAMRFLRVPTIYVLKKYKKNTKNLMMNFSIFTAEKIRILHGQVFINELATKRHSHECRETLS